MPQPEIETYTDTKFVAELATLPELLQLPANVCDMQLIRQGGMGAIYKGRHTVTGAKLAIKVMLPHLVKDITQIQRFVQESRLICALSNEHIVKVYDCGVSGQNTPFIVMDYIEGQSLRQRLESGPLDLKTGMNLFLQVSKGLSHAHKRGIIHRDIKPDNIMVTLDDDGNDMAKVVDFGIGKAYFPGNQDELANLTGTGEIVGTPYYMSPEQAMGQQLDPRCDIYSLGCVMYHVFTGTPPFTGVSVIQILAKHAKDPVPDSLTASSGSQLPAAIRNIIAKCLEKEPADRYASMEALQADLIRFQESGDFAMLTGKQKRTIRAAGRFVGSMMVGFVVVFVLVALFEYAMKMLPGT